jgi:hypothetical protein
MTCSGYVVRVDSLWLETIPAIPLLGTAATIDKGCCKRALARLPVLPLIVCQLGKERSNDSVVEFTSDGHFIKAQDKLNRH